MTIDEIWQELETEAKCHGTAAWLTRFALPQPAHPLLVAMEVEEKRRVLLLPLPKSDIPPRRDWPNCRGLEVFSIALAGQAHLGVRLLDATFADVFAALAEDVAPRVAASVNARAAAKALLDRLRRWQKFLAAGVAGLTVEQQRGLFGELHTLRAHLLPGMGRAAIDGWRAPRAAHQDFQFASGSLEVKTTPAKQPQAVRITSERQLDDTGIAALFLHVVVVDEREVEGEVTGVGESLPGIVMRLRELLREDSQAAETFDDRLLETGYLERDAPRYTGRRFTVRKELTFHVGAGFPRIVEGQLAPGVGDVSYSLSLAACEPFSLPVAGAVAELASAGKCGKTR
ncbi:MAG: PD-(D/E)XK motif protein [Verrucomicrobiia bacterium]